MLKARLWIVTYDYNTESEYGKVQEEFRKKEIAALFASKLNELEYVSNIRLKKVRAE